MIEYLAAACCSQYTYLFAMSTIFAFATAFGIGANDVANSFATSVGARSLKLWQAVIAAGIMEFLGAVLLGSEVSSTVRKKIVDVDRFQDQPSLLMIGMACSLFSTASWLLFCSRYGLPVSTTHSIIGSIIGFGFVAYGPSAIQWNTVYMIIASWFISPLLSGVCCALIFFLTRQFVLRPKNSPQRALTFYPLLIGVTIAINVFFVVLKGAKRFSSTLKDLPIWIPFVSAIGAGLICGFVLHFTFVNCFLRKRVKMILDGEYDPNTRFHDKKKSKNGTSAAQGTIHKQSSMEEGEALTKDEGKPKLRHKNPLSSLEGEDGKGTATKSSNLSSESTTDDENSEADMDDNPSGKDKKKRGGITKLLSAGVTCDVHEVANTNEEVHGIHDNAEKFNDATEYTFVYLQVFTACVSSFAHGANDVANSVGPYAAIVTIYFTGTLPSKTPVPEWILVFGGASIALGLALLGHNVIQKMGVELFKVTPSRGFAIELTSSLVSVVGSILGIPLSTTHVQVGAEVGCALLEGRKGVNYKLLIITFSAWIFTLIFCAILTGGLFAFVTLSPAMPGFSGYNTNITTTA